MKEDKAMAIRIEIDPGRIGQDRERVSTEEGRETARPGGVPGRQEDKAQTKGAEMNAVFTPARTEKFQKAQAGIVLLKQVEKKAAEQAEQRKVEKQEKGNEAAEENAGRTGDAAGRPDAKEGAAPRAEAEREFLRWILEMEAEQWKELLHWFPKREGDSVSLAEQLKELARLYRQLWTALTANTSGDLFFIQSERLYQALSADLNRLMDASLPDLLHFFQTYGREEAVSNLRGSLLYEVTGRTLTREEANAFWEAGRGGRLRPEVYSPSYGAERLAGGGTVSGGSAALGGTAVPGGTAAFGGAAALGGPAALGGTAPGGGAAGRPAELGGAADGSVAGGPRAARMEGGGAALGRAGGPDAGTGNAAAQSAAGKIGPGPENGVNQRMFHLPGRARGYVDCARDIRLSEELSAVRSGLHRGQGVETAISAGRNALYSSKEIERTQQFASHLLKEGNLFAREELAARNEEALGILASAMTIKAGFFTSRSGIGKAIGAEVRTAVERLVDAFLSEAARRQQNQSRQILDQRDIYKIYYQMMSQYQEKKSPADILENGILFAERIFEAKKASGAYKNASRYAPGSGLFGEEADGGEGPDGLRRGRQCLAKDWKEYLRSAGLEWDRNLQIDFISRSPWGMLAAPEGGRPALGKKELFLLGVSLAAGFALLYVLYS